MIPTFLTNRWLFQYYCTDLVCLPEKWHSFQGSGPTGAVLAARKAQNFEYCSTFFFCLQCIVWGGNIPESLGHWLYILCIWDQGE